MPPRSSCSPSSTSSGGGDAAAHRARESFELYTELEDDRSAPVAWSYSPAAGRSGRHVRRSAAVGAATALEATSEPRRVRVAVLDRYPLWRLSSA